MRLLHTRNRARHPGPVNTAALAELLTFPRREWVRASMVSTVDGSAGGVDGLSGSINTPADHRVYGANRAAADVVLVGAGTARAEGYRRGKTPIAVVTNSGRLPGNLAEGDGAPVVVLTCAASGRRPSEDVWICGKKSVDLREALAQLRERGWGRVLCEGGPSLLTSMLAQDLVDELSMTTSPMLVGGRQPRIIGGAELSVDLQLHHLIEESGTVIGLWRVKHA